MQFRKFGPTGRDVSIVGQGTWEIDQSKRDIAIAALRRGLDEGMTHVDTAEMYGDAELLIAEAISGRRNEAFLVSKVLFPRTLRPMAWSQRANARCHD